jgi:hypothetical protein
MCQLTGQGDLCSHSQTLHLEPLQSTAQKIVWTSPPPFRAVEARGVVRASLTRPIQKQRKRQENAETSSVWKIGHGTMGDGFKPSGTPYRKSLGFKISVTYHAKGRPVNFNVDSWPTFTTSVNRRAQRPCQV